MRDIVTGIQEAEASVRVLERALSEAETSQGELRVVTAWANPVLVGDLAGLGYGGTYVDTGECSTAAKVLVDELLAKAIAAYRPTGDPAKAEAEAHPGNAGSVLVAQSQGARLLVVGGRRHGALASAMLGSTTGYVLHHAACPVMVVPESTAPGPFLRVIVGVDGADCSRAALRWAFDAASRHHCPLTVVHANNVLGIPGRNAVYPDYDAMALSWLREEVADVLPDIGDVVVTSEVITGPASRVLLAKAGPDDLLVVGSRGRGGFVDLVLGSVASQCSVHARGALVVVHEDQERLDVE